MTPSSCSPSHKMRLVENFIAVLHAHPTIRNHTLACCTITESETLMLQTFAHFLYIQLFAEYMFACTPSAPNFAPTGYATTESETVVLHTFFKLFVYLHTCLQGRLTELLSSVERNLFVFDSFCGKTSTCSASERASGRPLRAQAK